MQGSSLPTIDEDVNSSSSFKSFVNSRKPVAAIIKLPSLREVSFYFLAEWVLYILKCEEP